jgi:SAC3/GANP family
MKKRKTSKQQSKATVADNDTGTTMKSPSIGNDSTTAMSQPHIISSLTVTKYETKKRQERMERFATNPSHNYNDKHQQQHPTATIDSTTGDSEEITVGPYYDIIGRNMEIEKSYLRLTTYPKCEDVRPLPILIKALDHVKRKYQQNDDFDWCNDQLKSIRQDITVQKSHIPANHTLLLDVYQTHARILLEHGQLSEFNQCLSNVLQIYDAVPAISNNTTTSSDTIPHSTGSKATMCSVRKAEGEFRAYSILYSLVQSKTTFLDLNMALRRRLQQHLLWTQHQQRPGVGTIKSKKKSKKRRRPSSTITATSTDDSNDPMSRSGMMHRISAEEQHAWDVVHSIYDGQYKRFFILYDTAPHMSPYILDFLLHRVRLHAYHVLISAYRSSIPILYVQQSLHFDTLEEVHHFLQQRGTVFVSSSTSSDDGIEHLLVDCRQSQLMLQTQDS